MIANRHHTHTSVNDEPVQGKLGNHKGICLERIRLKGSLCPFVASKHDKKSEPSHSCLGRLVDYLPHSPNWGRH